MCHEEGVFARWERANIPFNRPAQSPGFLILSVLELRRA